MRVRSAVLCLFVLALVNSSTIWVLVARNPAAFGKLVEDSRWKRLDTGPGQPVWTDEFSNILSVVLWLH